jgi:uncharacterized DUF497 family protein
MYIQCNKIEFEWSELKDQQNFWKHSVWFEEAKTIWSDPLYVECFDVNHSDQEDRFLRVGYFEKGRLLIVSYAEKHNGILVRIISARNVTLRERSLYEKGI